MTLIDDDHIEKIGLVPIVVRFEDLIGISPQGVLSFFEIHLIFTDSARECLIDREEYIGIRWDFAVASFDLTAIDLDDILFEWVECIHCLIHENIAISEDEDTRSSLPDPITRPSRIEELVGDLECDHRLPCSCGEREQYSLFLVGDRFHHFRDRDFLVVS